MECGNKNLIEMMVFKLGFKEDGLYGKNEKGTLLKAMIENIRYKNDLFS